MRVSVLEGSGLLGYSPGALARLRVLDLFRPSDQVVIEKHLVPLISNQVEPPPLDVEVRDVRGRYRPVRLTLRPVGSTETIAIIAVIRDLHLEQHEQARVDRRARLDQLVQETARRLAQAGREELAGVLDRCAEHVAEVFCTDQLIVHSIDAALRTGSTTWRWPGGGSARTATSAPVDQTLLDLVHTHKTAMTLNFDPDRSGTPEELSSLTGAAINAWIGDADHQAMALSREDTDGKTTVFCFRTRRDEASESIDPDVVHAALSILETIVGAIRRIEQGKAIAEQARWSQAVLERSSDYICVLTESGTITYASSSIAADGYDPKEILGNSIWSLVHEDDHEVARTILDNQETHVTIRIRRASGEWRYVEVRGQNLQSDPIVKGIVVNARDVTDRIALERDMQATTHAQEVLTRVMASLCTAMPGELLDGLQRALGVVGALVGSSAVTLYWPRPDGRAVPMMSVSPEGDKMVIEGIVPIMLPAMVTPLVIERSTDPLHPLIDAVHIESLPPLGMLFGIRLLGASGDQGILTFGHVSPEHGTDDAVLRILPAFAQVVTATVLRADAESRLQIEATVDPVTGLSNRAVMRRTLRDAIRNTKTSGLHVSLLLLDLDDFKMVNDGYGHHVGDALLAQLGHRLREACGPGDVIARLGGDEFVIIATGHKERGGAIADAVHGVLKSPFVVESLPLSVTGSIGVACVGPHEAAIEPGDLLRRADIAMYRAKNRDLGDTEFFDDAMGESAQGTAQIRLELERGLENSEIEIWLQSIVDVETGLPVGAEALARWNHPQRGLLAPDAFVPIAERSGLIGTLGMQVMHEAISTLAQATSDRRVPTDFYVSVNVAAPQLRDPTFPSTVLALLRTFDVRPEQLRLEVTESQLVERSLLAPLQFLRNSGVLVGIDDFGTGYSSLAMLQTLPVDFLKIDKSFIDRIHLDAQARTLAAAVIAMANSLGLETVAEGVEYREQIIALADLSCHSAQGFWYSRPLGVKDWLALLPPQGLCMNAGS